MPAVIITGIEQGTPEWKALRLGIPTASCMDRIITSRGEPSKQAEKYMFQLAVERITGVPTEHYVSWAMKEGNRREPESRIFYEMLRGVTVDTVSFVYSDERKRYGCSPDGLIGDRGGYETKNPEAHTHCKRLLEKATNLPDDYIVQVQASLLITGRWWWDFMDYYPGLSSIVVRVEPALALHTRMRLALERFCEELDEVEKKLREIET